VYNRRAGVAVHHHQFEQVPGPVRPKDQPADRVIAHFVEGDGLDDGVVDIFARDAVTQGRAENLTEESYYETARTAHKASM
jgi:hypothetical protein